MITRKKKKCSMCSVFTEQTIKLEGKKVCFGCLEKLFPAKTGVDRLKEKEGKSFVKR